MSVFRFFIIALTFTLISSFFFLHTASVHAATGINKQINFQGKLVNSDGTNVTDSSYSVVFSLYSVSSGGSNIWTETQSVTTVNGIFQVSLGSVTSLPGSVDFNTDNIYLGIKVGADAEMTPRVRFTAVPYAFNADKFAGLSAVNNTNNFTITGGTATSRTLTVSGADITIGSTITPTNAGTLTMQSNGANVLTLDAGGAAGLSLGTTNANAVSISKAGTVTTINGGLTVTTGQNFIVNGDTFTDLTGSGLSVSSNALTIALTSSGTTGLTSSNSGLEVSSSGLTLLKGCADGQILSYTDAGGWACAASGGGGSSTLAQAYTAGSAGDQTITLDSTRDSIIVSNPTSAGSDSAFTFKIEQLNTGVSTAGLYVDNRGLGAGLRIDDSSGDTTPFIVDGDGRVGIGTTSVTGTTERLLQIGSPTNRGNAAAYGEIVTKGFKQIQSLTNIKDVYIYDTSLDSDGGRWIDWATTEKLSWFTESLDDSPSTPCNISTMDRCYADHFPRKAILVVTTNALYIFDATNGNMWMKFGQNAAGWGLGADTNNDPSSVTALNGVIYVGTNGSAAGGLYVLDFLNDRMWNLDGTDRSGADVGIGSRNATVTYNSDNNTNFDLATVGTVADWGKINDVSVATLKNSGSAIAAATGPNNGTTVVGLATDSGLTLINLSTQKVTQYSDATDNDYNSVIVTPSGKLYGLNEALGQAEMWLNIDFNENVATKVNGTPDRVWDEASSPPLSKNAPTVIAGAPDALEVITNGSLADGGTLATAAAPSNSDLIYVGTDQGLTEIDDHQTAADGWSKFYTTTRQTPYMIGAIRRMHTMDDASGNVTNAAKASIMAAKGTPTYGVQGVRGTAMSFNGTSQYLCSDANSDGTCDNDTTDNMNTGGWTISTWFKHSTTITGTDVLFQRCYNTTPAAAAGCVAAAMTSTGTMGITVDMDATFSIGAATNNSVYHASVQAFNDNQWHFLAITRAATTGNINTMIDGKPIGQTAGVNTTLDAAQILSIGADCSVGAACSTGANFWDGQIDDFQYSANGSTTASSNVTSVPSLHRLYNDARPLLNKKVINVTDATTVSATTIGDSGEAWIPQEFAGQIVTLTGGTGVGQTRRVVSNTATVLTVSPAFTTTPDTTTDFKIDPEALYGASNNVTAIGVSKTVPLGEARMMCAGTNSGSDTGGITCYNHQAGPNLVADIYHADAKYLDDLGTEWTGTNFDNIQSIDITNRTMVFGSQAHTWIETQDIHLGNALDYFQGKLTDVRNQILTMGITTLAGQIGEEVGLSGGADLAEYYTSVQALEPGDVVALDASKSANVKRTTKAYQKDILGVVSTQPGLTLGTKTDDGYPLALSGRIPVKVTTENGFIQAGDSLTAASMAGHAMKATKPGRVLGVALEALDDSQLSPCSTDNVAVKCGTVLMFVNLTNSLGEEEQPPVARSMFDSQAVASDSAILSASMSANPRMLAMKELSVDGLATISATLRVKENGLIEGILTVIDTLVTNNSITNGLATFFGDVVFKGNVSFVGHPTFSNDTAGIVNLKKGAEHAEVTFAKPYQQTPIVNASLIFMGDDKEKEKELLAEGYHFVITKQTEKGFTILLDKTANDDLAFSWVALLTDTKVASGSAH